MNKAIILTAAAVLAAAVSAGAVDWTQDPVSQFKGEMPSFTPAASASIAPAPVKAAEGGVRIQAEARGSAVINHVGNDWDQEVTLATNNDGDRVGAEFTTCDPSTEHSNDAPATCEYADFIFPQLTVSGKNVYLNGELVAVIKKGFFSTKVKLQKGYALKTEKTPVTLDNGFDRSRVATVSLYLEKTAN
jgi:hypothetical protein